MHSKRKSLRPVALALPGMLVASLNLGAYTNRHVTEDGIGFSADAIVSNGYVFAQYDREGVGLDGDKTNRGLQGWDLNWATIYFQEQFSGQSLVTVSTF